MVMTSPQPAHVRDLASLAPSGRFAIALDWRGEWVAFEFVRPQRAISLSEQERVLLSCFPAGRATAVQTALDTFPRQAGAVSADQIEQTLNRLVEAGLLVDAEAATGPYTADMIDEYAEARAVPEAVGETIVCEAGVTPETSVLDLGAGAGALAIQLAGVSHAVTALDLSPNFLSIAAARAAALNRPLRLVQGDGNKLVLARESFDLIVCSQSFHWLDPYLATLGIGARLREHGCFVAVESKAVLDARHPFHTLLGYGSSSHDRARQGCVEHALRYGSMLSAIADPRFALTGLWAVRERRRFDLPFARAYFFADRVRTALGHDGDPWNDLEARLRACPPSCLDGFMYWMIARVARTSQPRPAAWSLNDRDVREVTTCGPEREL